ncbi:hypothetical protein ACFQ07_20930, partial [Actinomadura adrarensis]
MSGVPGPRRLWSLREDVHVEADPGTGSVILHSRWGAHPLPRTSPIVREALRRMTFGPISLENVTSDPAERARIIDVLEPVGHLVVRSVAAESDRLLLSVVPLAPEARFGLRDLNDGCLVRMSRFAIQRTSGDEYRLESPLSLHNVILHDPAAVRLVAPLGRPVRPGEVRSSGSSAGD